MKMFALIMLRCALIMHLSSFVQNGTLATLGEWEKSCQELKEWAAKCHKMVNTISKSSGFITLDDLTNIPNINHSLDVLLYEVNKFPLEGMDELLDRRLQKPLKMAISNCEKILNEVKQSGHEDNKKYLESLVSKTSSIAKRIGKEFNTFSVEVKLDLFTKFYRTFQERLELSNSILDLAKLSTNSYLDVGYFTDGWLKLSSGMGNNPRYEPGTPEFVDFVESLILNAKLKILEKELSEKIAEFSKQKEQIDVDAFMGFSDEFKAEWEQIEQKIITANVADKKIVDTEKTLRDSLDELANRALEGTAPLKAIITEKFDQLITKCQNSLGKFNKESKQRVAATKGMGPSKNVFKVQGSNKSNQKKTKK